jgi:hypothetical protein
LINHKAKSIIKTDFAFIVNPNNYISKISLFDILSILSSGFLILILIFPSCLVSSNNCNPIFAIILSYMIGLLYNTIMELIFNPLTRNKECLLKKSYAKVRKKKDVILKYSEHQYYIAYYYLLGKNCLNSVPTLEAQFAFIRNIWVIILLYLSLFPCCQCCILQIFPRIDIYILKRLLFMSFFVIPFIGIIRLLKYVPSFSSLHRL